MVNLVRLTPYLFVRDLVVLSRVLLPALLRALVMLLVLLRGMDVMTDIVLFVLLFVLAALDMLVRLMLIKHALAAHTTRCLLGSTCGPSIGPNLGLLTVTLCAMLVVTLARNSRLPTANAMWPLVVLIEQLMTLELFLCVCLWCVPLLVGILLVLVLVSSACGLVSRTLLALLLSLTMSTYREAMALLGLLECRNSVCELLLTVWVECGVL